MSAFRHELQAEVDRLRIENESLKARLIVAEARPAAAKRVSDLPANWGSLGRAAMLTYLADKAREAGFPNTPEGVDAYRAAEKRKLMAWVREQAATSPEARAHMIRTFGRAYVDGEPATESLPNRGSFAEPAVRQHSFEEITATPEKIARAVAIANGEIVEMPSNPTARAILRAHQRATDPDARPL